MGFDWETILDGTSYEDEVQNAAERLEKQDASDDGMSEAKERELLAEVRETKDFGFSVEDYEDCENEEVKKEGKVLRLYRGEGNLLEGELEVWRDYGITSTSEGLPFVPSSYSSFTLDVKNGDITLDDEMSLLVDDDELTGMVCQALEKYNPEVAKTLIGKIKISRDEEGFLF